MTIEEAVKVLERQFDKSCGNYRCQNARKLDYEDALWMAISALRAQGAQEENEPLTLDELREIDGEPVYMVDLTGNGHLWTGWIVFASHNDNGFIPRGFGFFSNEGYGTTWLAYRHKPGGANV